MALSTETESLSGNSEANSRRRKRIFVLGGFRFRLSNMQLFDMLLHGLSWFLETVVYLIGPLLIILALSIVGLLTFSYFTILLPMLEQKYALSPMKNLLLILHTSFVIFVLGNILFNYYLCVMTKHTGPKYDKVVRALAQATGLLYPETPAQMQQYRQDYEDRMYLRMQRRMARSETAERLADGNNIGIVQRHTTTASNVKVETENTQQKKEPVRAWMVMGPFEWGYCRETNQPKPPRSHFDHVSKKLILNLDHYCPWMFNAIGYFNYRYFVTFLIFIFVGMVYGMMIAMEPFLLIGTDEYKNQYKLEKRSGVKPERLSPMLPFRDEKMLVTLCFMLCTAVGAAVLLLGGFHVYLTLTGQTTIEFHANWSNRRRAKAINRKWSNPYSSGSPLANWEQVFGSRRPWVLGLLPSARDPEFLPVPILGHASQIVEESSTATSIFDSGMV